MIKFWIGALHRSEDEFWVTSPRTYNAAFEGWWMYHRPDAVDFERMAANERNEYTRDVFTDEKIAKLKRMLEEE